MLLVVTMILLGEFATLTLKGCHDHVYGKSMNPAPFSLPGELVLLHLNVQLSRRVVVELCHQGVEPLWEQVFRRCMNWFTIGYYYNHELYELVQPLAVYLVKHWLVIAMPNFAENDKQTLADSHRDMTSWVVSLRCKPNRSEEENIHTDRFVITRFYCFTGWSNPNMKQAAKLVVQSCSTGPFVVPIVAGHVQISAKYIVSWHFQ